MVAARIFLLSPQVICEEIFWILSAIIICISHSKFFCSLFKFLLKVAFFGNFYDFLVVSMLSKS